MPYNVNFTDSQNTTPITVFDNTSNTESTSLTFPGRNVTGYGQIIAENFLHLLENFSSPTAPQNPVEGQIWFNSDPTVASLFIWDGGGWKSASGVQKSPVRPSVAEAKIGELWVDTVNQQLYVFSGTDWILVGPNFSTGLRSGLIVEQIIDSEDITRVVLSVFVEDRPIVIISKDSFTPKLIIPQFPTIRAGVNIAQPDPAIPTQTEIYDGGLLPKLYGVAQSSDALQISNTAVPAGRFLRSDIVNVVENAFNIRSDSGITIGIDGTFSISTSSNSGKIYNSLPGSPIDLQVNSSGLPTTVLRVIDGRVGINTISPNEALDVTGNTHLRGELIITNTSATTNENNGSIRTKGGVYVSKNVIVNDTLQVNASTFAADILPITNDRYELGGISKRWKTIRAKSIVAETIQGVLDGSISGNAATATSLQQKTTFTITGDITAPSIEFNGVAGGTIKNFNTTISPTFFTSKQDIATLTTPQKSYSLRDDYVLVFRPTVSGLVRATRDTFVGDLGIPIGGILPFAGTNVPFGFLLCDGSEVLIAKYQQLYQVIGTTYNGDPNLILGQDTFRLPDLRGRFPLGRDNMDNGEQIQTPGGQVVDGGGGNADVVAGTEADTLGGKAGDDQYNLSTSNLPNHEHNMIGSAGQQYYAVRSDTAVPLDSGAFLNIGGTTANRLQYLPSSGGIKTAGALGQPYPVMNPFLTINYIIRSGPSAF